MFQNTAMWLVTPESRTLPATNSRWTMPTFRSITSIRLPMMIQSIRQHPPSFSLWITKNCKMGNVQQSSPFVFHSFPAPSEPFAAEKLRFSRRLVPDAAPMNQHCGTEDESSMASSSSSIPSIAQINSPILPPKLTTHRTILQQLIELQDWQRVLCRLELYPDELHQFFPIFVDRSKLAMTMPSATVPPLITGKRSITKKNHAAIFVTPLHLVCALNPPLHVVATILRLGGPERASRWVHPATRTNAMHQKHLFWKNRRHRMLRSGGNNRRRHAHRQRND